MAARSSAETKYQGMDLTTYELMVETTHKKVKML